MRMALVMLALTAATALAGCKAKDEREPAGPRVVRVAEVGSAAQATRSVTGVTRATTQAVLAFEVGGRVQDLNGRIGDEVEAGETLASLDPAAFELAAGQARAELARAEAAMAEVASRLDRQQRLSTGGWVAPAAVEAVAAEMDAARQAAAAARAQVEMAERNLSLTRLVAPFEGRVARRLVEPFATVAPGAPVYELDGPGLEVVAPVPLAWAGGLAEGSALTVVAPAGLVEGRLSEIAPRSAEAGAVDAVVMLPDGLDLRSGATVEVRLPLGEEAALEVPFGALLPATVPGQGRVFVVEDGLAQPREVSFSRLQGDTVRIDAGLRAGDVVVTAGARFLTAGQPVTPAEGRVR